MKEIKFELSGTVPPKKNSRQQFKNKKTGKTFNTPSERYKTWHGNALAQLLSQGITKRKIERVDSVSMIFYVPDQRNRDISNMLESVMDLMVDHGVLLDDNWKVVPQYEYLRAEFRKGNGGVAVTIKGDF